jgi:hypothetical protein
MRLDVNGALHQSTHALDLTVRNNRGVARPSHYGQYSGGIQDLELAVQPATDEHITRKQRQTEMLGTVSPSVGSSIEWKKHVMAFARKNAGNRLFVLMPCVQSMPLKCGAGILGLQWVPHQTQVAPPCDLHRRSAQTASPQLNLHACAGCTHGPAQAGRLPARHAASAGEWRVGDLESAGKFAPALLLGCTPRPDPGVDPARALIEQALPDPSHRFKFRWAVGLRSNRPLSAKCTEGAAPPAPGHSIPRDSVRTLCVRQPCRSQDEAEEPRFEIIHAHSCPRRQQFQQRWSRVLFRRLTCSNERSPRSQPRNRSPLGPSNCGPLARHALLH